MVFKRIIPCLDVQDGRVVKGTQFLDLKDAGDPAECASLYDAEGADEICFLDITATHEDRDTLYDLVSRTAERLSIPLTVGGGVRKVEDVRRLLDAGADKIAINSAAVRDPNLIDAIASQVGRQCIVVAIDGRGGTVYVRGGREPTERKVIEWAREVADRGAGEILFTSMDRDGTKLGYDLEVTGALVEAVDVPVIASGGVGTIDHLYEGLVVAKAQAVLAASIFHFGTFTVRQVREALLARGVPVRPVATPTPAPTRAVL